MPYALLRRPILHPTGQQVDLFLAELGGILGHWIIAAFMLDGTKKPVIMAFTTGRPIGTEIDIVLLGSRIMAS